MVGVDVRVSSHLKEELTWAIDKSVADLGGGVSRVPWNPPFGFSDDRRLRKPGF